MQNVRFARVRGTEIGSLAPRERTESPELFNRKTTDAPEVTEPAKAEGKGRPTPTRKEAEAAAKQRAKTVIDAKGRAKQQRLGDASKVRDAMRTGDDRYLPARDRGPVKRFVRDWIDARFSIVEFILPLLVVTMALGFSGTQSARNLGGILQIMILLLIALEGGWIVFALKRALAKKFPDDSTRGVTMYALMRAMNMRFLRMPKTQVARGGKPINRK